MPQARPRKLDISFFRNTGIVLVVLAMLAGAIALAMAFIWF